MAIMRAREEPFVELRPFYGLGRYGLLVVWLAMSLASATSLDRSSPAIAIGSGIVTMLAFSGAALVSRRIAQRRIARLDSAARSAESEAMRRALLEWRTIVSSEVTTRSDVELWVVPGAHSVMWTSDLRGAPRIFVSTGFWVQRKSHDWQVALLHELGHVHAGDVPILLRLIADLRATFIASPFVFIVLAVRYVCGHRLDALDDFSLIALELLIATVSVLLAWSALLSARELQADLFAAERLRDPERVKRFLLARGSSRGTWVDRLWTAAIQPRRAFRSLLPAAIGEYGTRIDVCLGLALGGLLQGITWCGHLLESELRLTFRLGLWAPLLLVPSIYRFAWSAAERRPGLAGLSRHLLSGARIVALVLLVEAACTWGQSLVTEIPMTNVGGVNAFIAAICAVGVTLSLVVWATSEVALVVDTRRSPRTPRTLSALLGFAVVSSAAFISVSLLYLFFPTPLGTASLFAATFMALAIVLFTLASFAHLLARGPSHESGSNLREHSRIRA